MNDKTRNRLARLSAIALAVGTLAVAGCSQRDQDAARAKTDQAVAEVKDKTREVVADTKQAASEMKAGIKEATADAKADIKEATAEVKADAKQAGADARPKADEIKADTSAALDKAKVAVSDAAITTSVKAELAKDSVLKARDINVDTERGRVSLRGTAPTAAARDRATTLANAVNGVVSVQNDLTVSSS